MSGRQVFDELRPRGGLRILAVMVDVQNKNGGGPKEWTTAISVIVGLLTVVGSFFAVIRWEVDARSVADREIAAQWERDLTQMRVQVQRNEQWIWELRRSCVEIGATVQTPPPPAAQAPRGRYGSN